MVRSVVPVGNPHALELDAEPHVESSALSVIRQADIDYEVPGALWAPEATYVVRKMPGSDLMGQHDWLRPFPLVSSSQPSVRRRHKETAKPDDNSGDDASFLKACEDGEHASITARKVAAGTSAAI